MKNLSNIIIEKLKLNDKIISPNKSILDKLVRAIKTVLGDVTVSEFTRAWTYRKETIYEINPDTIKDIKSVGDKTQISKFVHYCEKIDDLPIEYKAKEEDYFYNTRNRDTKYGVTIIGNDKYWVKIVWNAFNWKQFCEIVISKDLFDSGIFKVDNSNAEKRHWNRIKGYSY